MKAKGKSKRKVKKSVANRFRVTKNGKVIFAHQYHSHKRSKKSKARLRRQKEPGQLTGKFARKIKTLLSV